MESVLYNIYIYIYIYHFAILAAAPSANWRACEEYDMECCSGYINYSFLLYIRFLIVHHISICYSRVSFPPATIVQFRKLVAIYANRAIDTGRGYQHSDHVLPCIFFVLYSIFFRRSSNLFVTANSSFPVALWAAESFSSNPASPFPCAISVRWQPLRGVQAGVVFCGELN